MSDYEKWCGQFNMQIIKIFIYILCKQVCHNPRTHNIVVGWFGFCLLRLNVGVDWTVGMTLFRGR